MKPILPTFFCLLLCSLTAASQSFDLEPIHAGPVSYLVPGSYPVQFTLHNHNMDYMCTQFQLNWQLDNGPVQSYDVSTSEWGGLYPDYPAIFEHPVPLVITETGNYTLKIWTANPGGQPDPNPGNDLLETTVQVVDYLPERNMVLFIGTHTDCFPCGGYGEIEMYAVLEAYPEKAFIVSAHDNAGTDPYECEDAITFNDVYIWPNTGHPGFTRDLFLFPELPNIVYGIDGQLVLADRRMQYLPPADIAFENLAFDDVNDVLSGELHAHFYVNYSGQLAVNVVLTEDSIYGYQFGAPGDSLYHRHVMRDMAYGIYGSTDGIPTEISAGDEIVSLFSMPVSADFVFQQLHIAGYIQRAGNDSTANEILNAAREKLADHFEGNTNDVASRTSDPSRLFPNPASGFITITGAIDAGTAIDILDPSGRVMKRITNASINSRCEVDISDLSPGCYIARSVSGNNIIRLPFVVVR
jgi:hypothetical protein